MQCIKAKTSGEHIQISPKPIDYRIFACAYLERRMTQALARTHKLMSEPHIIATEHPAEEARGARHWEFHRVTVRCAGPRTLSRPKPDLTILAYIWKQVTNIYEELTLTKTDT